MRLGSSNPHSIPSIIFWLALCALGYLVTGLALGFGKALLGE